MNWELLLGVLIFFSMLQSDPITVPKVEHETKSYTSTVEIVKRTCPDGYEAHFVDIREGFDQGYWLSGTGLYNISEPGYTICFKTDFMDKVRNNPEMLAARPSPPTPM